MSAAVHATNLAIHLTSRTCLTIIEFSDYFDRVSLYLSPGEKYSCCWYNLHYGTCHIYVNFTTVDIYLQLSYYLKNCAEVKEKLELYF